MNFLIYGAGSLGLLFSYYLSKQNSVEVVAKHKKKEALKKNGLVFIKDSFKENINLNVTDSIEKIKNEPDFIILSVKNFDIDAALDDIAKIFNDRYVITIQNGVYAEHAAERVFGSQYTLPVSVLIGSKMINDNTIEQFLDNGLKVGYLNYKSQQKAKELNSIFINCGINSTLTDNIMRDKWHKMMFYCAGATLNSLTGTKDLSNEYLEWMVKRILSEIVNVAKNLDMDFDIEELSSEVYNFLMNFKPKKWSASVGEDLRKGKKTEIDFLNGYIVKLSEKFGVDVCINKTLFSLVKTLEKQNENNILYPM